MNQSYLSVGLEKVQARFKEVDILIELAQNFLKEDAKYRALCRSAHVLLISHFEGIYKEVCKDVLDDISQNVAFDDIAPPIINTHLNYFVQNNESPKSVKAIKDKLIAEFKYAPVKLKIDPFLFIDNKNPAPDIIETILERFGIKNFFWSLDGSDFDISFQDSKVAAQALRDSVFNYLVANTFQFPYTVEKAFYNPSDKTNQKKQKTLWEDFLNNLLKDRHSIVHGTNMTNPLTHEELDDARLKIEIVSIAYILNICCTSSFVKL